MALEAKRSGTLVLRLIVGLTLLGWPRVGSAQGTWSVIATAGSAVGQVHSPTALAVDTAGNLYVAERSQDDSSGNLVGVDRIQKRDAQGHWSVIATPGTAPGQDLDPLAVAVDAAGNLYVADYGDDGQGNSGDRIQKRDARGDWSVIATEGFDIGQVYGPRSLAVDVTGNLYVAEFAGDRIQKRDPQGNWSVIATVGPALGQVFHPAALAVDTVGNLYVAEHSFSFECCPPKTSGADRIQQRDAQGKWSLIAAQGSAPGPEIGRVLNPTALAADTKGALYVAERRWCYEPGCISSDRVQKRYAEEWWDEIDTEGTAVGQVYGPTALAVDGAGNLYVADSDSNRVLKFMPQP